MDGSIESRLGYQPFFRTHAFVLRMIIVTQQLGIVSLECVWCLAVFYPVQQFVNKFLRVLWYRSSETNQFRSFGTYQSWIWN